MLFESDFLISQLFVQSLSHIPLLATPWTAACQAFLSCAISRSLLKFMSMELMMVSNHLILCHPLLLNSYLSLFPLRKMEAWKDLNSLRVSFLTQVPTLRWPLLYLCICGGGGEEYSFPFQTFLCIFAYVYITQVFGAAVWGKSLLFLLKLNTV